MKPTKMENTGIKPLTKAWAISSLVTSIIGFLLFIMPYFGIIFSICSIVFYTKDKTNSGMSMAGLVVGIIGTVTNSFMLICLIIVLAFGL